MSWFDDVFAVVKTIPVLANYYAGGQDVTKNILNQGQVQLTGYFNNPQPKQVGVSQVQVNNATKRTAPVPTAAQMQATTNSVLAKSKVPVPVATSRPSAPVTITRATHPYLGLPILQQGMVKPSSYGKQNLITTTSLWWLTQRSH